MEDEHRIFLQGLMCKGVLDVDEVLSLHEGSLTLCKMNVPASRKEHLELLGENILTINDCLSSLGLVVRKGLDEDTGSACYMLINTSNRMVGNSRELGTSVQSKWTQQELEYIRLLATEILRSDNKEISKMEACKLVGQVSAGHKRLTLDQAQSTIERLIQARWMKTLGERGGRITLDVRFIGEMETWMLEVLGGEVAKCQICKKIVVRGSYCHCQDGQACHTFCIRRQLKGGVEFKCKKCGSPFGSAAAANTEMENEPREKRSRNGSRSEEGDDPTEESIEESAGPSGRQGRSRIKRRAILDDSDSD